MATPRRETGFKADGNDDRDNNLDINLASSPPTASVASPWLSQRMNANLTSSVSRSSRARRLSSSRTPVMNRRRSIESLPAAPKTVDRSTLASAYARTDWFPGGMATGTSSNRRLTLGGSSVSRRSMGGGGLAGGRTLSSDPQEQSDRREIQQGLAALPDFRAGHPSRQRDSTNIDSTQQQLQSLVRAPFPPAASLNGSTNGNTRSIPTAKLSQHQQQLQAIESQLTTATQPRRLYRPHNIFYPSGQGQITSAPRRLVILRNRNSKRKSHNESDDLEDHAVQQPKRQKLRDPEFADGASLAAKEQQEIHEPVKEYRATNPVPAKSRTGHNSHDSPPLDETYSGPIKNLGTPLDPASDPVVESRTSRRKRSRTSEKNAADVILQPDSSVKQEQQVSIDKATKQPSYSDPKRLRENKDTWKCNDCSFDTNPSKASKCQKCNKLRVTGSWGEMFKVSGWKCPACSITNIEESKTKCPACETDRPGAAGSLGTTIKTSGWKCQTCNHASIDESKTACPSCKADRPDTKKGAASGKPDSSLKQGGIGPGGFSFGGAPASDSAFKSNSATSTTAGFKFEANPASAPVSGGFVFKSSTSEATVRPEDGVKSFQFGVSSSSTEDKKSTATATVSAPPFTFGTIPFSDGPSATGITVSAPLGTASTGFSFGTSAAAKASAPEASSPSPKPFKFQGTSGSTDNGKGESDFSNPVLFGAPAASASSASITTSNEPPKTSAPSTQPFAFGSASAAPAPTDAVSKTAFTFGAATSAPSNDKPANGSAPFMFGASSDSASGISLGRKVDRSDENDGRSKKRRNDGVEEEKSKSGIVQSSQPFSTTMRPGTSSNTTTAQAPSFSFGQSSNSTSQVTSSASMFTGFGGTSVNANDASATTTSATSVPPTNGGSGSAAPFAFGSSAPPIANTAKNDTGGTSMPGTTASAPFVFGSSTSSSAPAATGQSSSGAGPSFTFGQSSTSNPTGDAGGNAGSSCSSMFQFGSSSTNAPGPSQAPAGPTFGAPPPPSAPTFGSAPSATSVGGNMFGTSSTSDVGAPSMAPTTFGGAPAAPSQPFAFGSNANAGPQSSIPSFGQSSQQQQNTTSVPFPQQQFGAPPQAAPPAPGGSTFGFGSTTAPAPVNSGFGSAAPFGGFGSGSANGVPNNAPVSFGAPPVGMTGGFGQPVGGFGAPASSQQQPSFSAGGFGGGGASGGFNTVSAAPPAGGGGFQMGTRPQGPRGRRIVKAKRPVGTNRGA